MWKYFLHTVEDGLVKTLLHVLKDHDASSTLIAGKDETDWDKISAPDEQWVDLFVTYLYFM
jgi:hypothetical protein